MNRQGSGRPAVRRAGFRLSLGARGGMLLAALLMTAPPAGGAEQSRDDGPSHAGTERITVEGEGRIAAGAPTSFVTVIRPEDHAGSVTTLADLLDRTAGVRVRSFGGLDSLATISIRGSSAEQVIVMIDGVPLNSPMGGGVDLSSISLAGVDAVEVHRGFAPASSGSSSIGGVVNIRSRPPGDGAGAAGSVAVGSHRTTEVTGRVDLPGSLFGWILSADAFSSRGDFEFLDNNATWQTNLDDEIEVRENNEGWEGAVRFHGRSGPGRQDPYFVSGEWTRRRHGVPGLDSFQFTDARSEINRALVRGGRSWEKLGGRPIDLEASLDQTWQTEAYTNTDSGGPLDTESWTRIHGTGARLLAVWQPAAEHRISFLAEPRLERAVSGDHRLASPPVEATRRSFKAAVEDEIRLASGLFVLAPSIRLDLIRSGSDGGSPGSTAGPAGDPSAISGRLGGLWVLSSRWSVRGNVGRFHRAPDLLELYGNQGTVRGNPSLRPESGLNADLGLSFHGDRRGRLRDFEFETALFRTHARDLIQLFPVSFSAMKAFNVGDARITGLESTISFRLGALLSASANYTRQIAEDRSDTFQAGRDLPGRPRHEGATSLALTVGRVTGFHRFTYVGGNELGSLGGASANLSPAARSLTRLPARYLHDLGLRLSAGRAATITLEAVNIFDRRVVDIARFPLPGRMLFLKLRKEF